MQSIVPMLNEAKTLPAMTDTSAAVKERHVRPVAQNRSGRKAATLLQARQQEEECTERQRKSLAHDAMSGLH